MIARASLTGYSEAKERYGQRHLARGGDNPVPWVAFFIWAGVIP